MSESICLDTYNLIIKNVYFPKKQIIISNSIRLHKNHNSTCDQYFLVKLVPLDSAHIELANNPC